MRLPHLVFCLALPTTAMGQAPVAASKQPVLTVTSGAFVAISVLDLDATTKWYMEKLGLSVVRHMPRTDATRASATILRGGGLMVELVRQDEVSARAERPRTAGIFKVGVTVDDFEGTLSALRARGIEIAYGPYPRRGDQPANLIIRDNEGNLIQVFGK